MSYIKRMLETKQNNADIVDFLISEGFESGSGAMGEGTMYYVASGDYTVWFALCEDYISLYAEYDCGGHVGDMKYYFKEDNLDSFKEAYAYAVDWAKSYM